MGLKVPQTTEDLKWQEIYKSCRCTQEAIGYAWCRLHGMSTEEAKQTMNKEFHYGEVICDIKPSVRQPKELSVKEV